MQIVANSTAMAAGLTVAVDKEGRDHCVVAVKGTFAIGPRGEPVPAETQEPLATGDVLRGEPGRSSVLYEDDGLADREPPDFRGRRAAWRRRPSCGCCATRRCTRLTSRWPTSPASMGGTRPTWTAPRRRGTAGGGARQ